MEAILFDSSIPSKITKRSKLPFDGELVQGEYCGLNYLAVEKMCIEKARVYIKDYGSWDSAFECLMDKAGY